MQASRIFNGIRFHCIQPGQWISHDKRFGIFCMMAGTTHEQWEIYEGTGDDPLGGEMIAYHFTLSEAVRDWARSTKLETA